MNAQIINIGDEILIGQIVNTNAAWMARQLNRIGIHVSEVKVIADSKEAILQSIRAVENSTLQIVLITGGLGPTKDDRTKHALAAHFGLELAYHAPSFENIETVFAQFGRKADDRYKLQAYMPVGAEVLINKMGTASGMWFKHKGIVFVAMPGVPREMNYLMEHEVLPRLRTQFETPTILHHTILTTGKGETDLSEMLEAFETSLPQHIQLAYLPKPMGGLVRLRLSARGQNEQALQRALNTEVAKLSQILGNLIYGEGEMTLSQAVGELLQKKGGKVGTAESCTGGNIAHQLTSTAGSSAYFKGGVIAYSNALKIKLLHVSKTTIAQHGAVSEPTVREMATGLLQSLEVDYVIAVSGIAGPSGGHPGKPVGTIWLAIGDKNRLYTKKLQLSKDRTRNIQLTTTIALDILRKFLLGDL